MNKKNANTKKLSLKKLQMAKINNPGKIFGRTLIGLEAECTFTSNGSKPQGGGGATI